MSHRHGNSRRQAYGRRMKDLRTRRTSDLEVDLDGPREWNRGDAWEADEALRRASLDGNHTGSSARSS
jgi:hypothetical protein